MSPELMVYLGGAFGVLAYSAYIDTDDPLPFIFMAITWPLLLAFAVPVAFGYTLRWLVKRVAP